MSILAASLVALFVICVGWPWSRSTRETTHWVALVRPERAYRHRRPDRAAPFWVRLIPANVEAAIRHARKGTREGPDLLDRQLRYAGLADIITAEQFVCLRILAPAALFGVLCLIYLTDPALFRLVLAVAGGAVGIQLPDHWLKQQVKKQQEAVRRELPSVLTTLGVLLDAGLNLVPALQEIVDRKDGVLTRVLGEALRETALGTPIQDALELAAAKCGVHEFTLFVSVLTQAMAKGAGGISEAVRGQSRQIWSLRQQQVQEKGQEMSQDLFFILLFLGFPAIALFLLGPVGLSLYQMFF